jgi:hypothetical protein
MIESRKIGFAGHEACMGVKKHACSVLKIKFLGQEQLERHRFRLEYNIKMDLKRIGNLNFAGHKACMGMKKHAYCVSERKL